jgi:hypothetical protein
MPDILLAIVALGLAALYLREYVLHQRLLRTQHKVLEESEQKGYQTVHDASLRAQEILKQAELESIKIVTDTKQGFLQNQIKYEQQLSEVVQHLGQTAQTEIANSQERLKHSEELFNQYLSDLEAKLSKSDQSSQDFLKTNTDQIFKQFQDSLHQYLTDAQQKSIGSIEEEVKSTHQKIKDYQDQRYKAVNDNLVTVLEKTLNLVLTKKLTLQDHVDLVYESFEKAREENLIV